MDGMVLASMAVWTIADYIKHSDKEKENPEAEESDVPNAVDELVFDFPSNRSDFLSVLDETATAMRTWHDDFDVKHRVFDGFGRSEIKKVGIHPDTFVQVAMQVAIYLTHQRYKNLILFDVTFMPVTVSPLLYPPPHPQRHGGNFAQ